MIDCILFTGIIAFIKIFLKIPADAIHWYSYLASLTHNNSENLYSLLLCYILSELFWFFFVGNVKNLGGHNN